MKEKVIRFEIALLAGVFLLPALTLFPRLAAGQIENIDARRAATLIAEHQLSEEFIIIDVRSPGEFAGGRIKHSVNIPIQAPYFRDRLQDFDREWTYLVYCAVGRRSSGAVNVMKELGFTKIYHLQGGIKQWRAVGLPLQQ